MGRKNELGIRKEDYDTPQEYNRARMRVVLRQKSHDTQVERWDSMLQFIDECYEKGMVHSDIVNELADTSPYILKKPSVKQS